MEDKRWNQMVDLVNEGRPVTDLNPPVQNDEEERIFNNMVRDLAKQREKFPGANFAHIDDEWGIVGWIGD